VVLEDGVASAGTATSKMEQAARFSARLRYDSALKGFAADLTDAQLAKVKADPAVAFVEPDTVVSAAGLAAPAPGETLPTGIRRVGAATATAVHGPSTTNVAVLDTGADLANPDLNVVSGTNCITPNAVAKDDNGHGTNVAGIIAARNNGMGVAGVAPGTKLYAVKVLGKNGTGTLSQFLCGINWVTANAASLGIGVANMSITGGGADDGDCGRTNNDSEHKAICSSVAAGVTYVVSAGNAKADFARSVPAAYREVLTVTAMSDTDGIPGAKGPAPRCVKGEADDRYASYSNYAVSAAAVAHTIAAPGTCVVSDKAGGGTSTYNGTSQAAPHVAGAVALCEGSDGVAGPCAGLAPAAVIQQLRSDSATAATFANGFAGDPLRPLTGRQYGSLVAAGLY
jgi:subtilisin family serine protease